MGSFLQFCIFSTLLKYASACVDGKVNFLLENTLLFVCFLSSFFLLFYFFLITGQRFYQVAAFAFSATLLDDLVTKRHFIYKKEVSTGSFSLILNVQKTIIIIITSFAQT